MRPTQKLTALSLWFASAALLLAAFLAPCWPLVLPCLACGLAAEAVGGLDDWQTGSGK